MNKLFPALILLVGLGIFISFSDPSSSSKATGQTRVQTNAAVRRIGQASVDPNPFNRYLANVQRNWPEPALVRFARNCGIDVDLDAPRFAERPEQKWISVRDLSNALKDLETDFYGTIAVWRRGEKILVEEWGMELDTGDYNRTFYCLNKQKITNVESTTWMLDQHENSSRDSGWGYIHSWALDLDGSFTTVSQEFIDLMEKPAPAPKLDADTQQELKEQSVGPRTLADLQIPEQMIQ